MRDLIWTLILIWVGYRLFTAFKMIYTGKSQRSQVTRDNTHQSGNASAASSDEQKKRALRRKLNEEGEYVDFEEIR